MNGLVEVLVGQKRHILRFSMLACMEFERRIFENVTLNPAKFLTDMVYSGLYGEAMRSELPAPSYAEAYDLLEELSQQDDYIEQSKKIQDTYETSKYGAELTERMLKLADEVKKTKPVEEKKKTSTKRIKK